MTLDKLWITPIYESQSEVDIGNWYYAFNAIPTVSYRAYTVSSSGGAGGNQTCWATAGSSAPSATSGGTACVERVGANSTTCNVYIDVIAIGTYS